MELLALFAVGERPLIFPALYISTRARYWATTACSEALFMDADWMQNDTVSSYGDRTEACEARTARELSTAGCLMTVSLYGTDGQTSPLLRWTDDCCATIETGSACC